MVGRPAEKFAQGAFRYESLAPNAENAALEHRAGSLASAGLFFFWSGVLSALSQPIAAWVARRIGLVNIRAAFRGVLTVVGQRHIVLFAREEGRERKSRKAPLGRMKIW